MRRLILPALTGLLLVGGCSQNREYPDERPYPQADRAYRDDVRHDGEWASPAGRALAMRDELRLTDRQIDRLARIRHTYDNRNRPHGRSEAHRNPRSDDERMRRNFLAERREVEAVLTEDQRDRFFRR